MTSPPISVPDDLRLRAHLTDRFTTYYWIFVIGLASLAALAIIFGRLVGVQADLDTARARTAITAQEVARVRGVVTFFCAQAKEDDASREVLRRAEHAAHPNPENVAYYRELDHYMSVIHDRQLVRTRQCGALAAGL